MAAGAAIGLAGWLATAIASRVRSLSRKRKHLRCRRPILRWPVQTVKLKTIHNSNPIGSKSR